MSAHHAATAWAENLDWSEVCRGQVAEFVRAYKAQPDPRGYVRDLLASRLDSDYPAGAEASLYLSAAVDYALSRLPEWLHAEEAS